MTPESQRWTALATHIAQGYADAPGIEGILIGGSVARGLADVNSDVDLFVFCRQFPDKSLRQTAVDRVNGERWRAHDSRDQGLLRDCFHADDGRIDVEFVLVSAYEALIRDVLANHDISRAKQGLLGGLLDAQIIQDSGLVAHWRRQIAQYPDGLQQRVVEHHLLIDPLWVAEIYARKRGDLLYLCDALCRVANAVLGLLHGLNRRYQPNEYKRLDWIVSHFQLAPENIANRLRDILQGPPLDGVQKLEQIVAETFDLLETHLPTLDMDAARAEFTTDTDTEPE
ncbi:MAG: DUF4037 domain-containing protein [Candidatus Latescibacteria bacterium]|nr:DUF4037 domain-containing protein [Candidatus Latescibacterota bacterium]